MKIAIVENNEKEQNRLISYINQYCCEFDLPANIVTFNDGLQIVDKYTANFDIIYFDVEMPLMDGMTAAKKIRAIDDKVTIVFVTNYVQWAIEGYSVNARDFLLKPLTYFNFKEHFKKLTSKLINKNEPTITLKVNSGYRKVTLDDIYYIESDGHYLNINLLDDTITILESMKKMEERLSDNRFYRCHNGYIVNLKHVTSIDKNVVHLGDFSVQVSRPKKKDFLSKLTNYIGSEVN